MKTVARKDVGWLNLAKFVSTGYIHARVTRISAELFRQCTETLRKISLAAHSPSMTFSHYVSNARPEFSFYRDIGHRVSHPKSLTRNTTGRRARAGSRPPSALASDLSRADTEKAFRTAIVLLPGADGHGVTAGGRSIRQRGWQRRRQRCRRCRPQQFVLSPRYPYSRRRQHHVHVLRQRW